MASVLGAADGKYSDRQYQKAHRTTCRHGLNCIPAFPADCGTDFSDARRAIALQHPSYGVSDEVLSVEIAAEIVAI